MRPGASARSRDLLLVALVLLRAAAAVTGQCELVVDEWAPVCADGLTFANWHALYCADPLAAARPAAWLPGACADDDRRALTDAAHDDGSGAGANGTANGAHRNASAAHDDHADAHHAEHAEHEHVHAYLLVCFAFVAIFVGVVTEFLLEKHLPQLPYTVALFVEGMAVALVHVWTSVEGDERHVWSRSLHMWLHIDPHVLLFAFLPLLLFGDAMSLNTHHFQQKFLQCLLLALPGVLVGAFAMGLLAYGVLPARYEWDMNMCMTFGAILAATDPVAVVALLKSLGASAGLTMIITGESLLNDGTAMVLFNLFYDRLSGSPDAASTPREILATFAQMALGGPALGFVFGLGALVMLYVLSEREAATLASGHTGATWQFSVTLACAYLSFFVGEHVCAVSGVLCTVTAALVLAEAGQPLINNHKAMERVWHTLEFVGNTIIFLLAGALVGEALTLEHIQLGRDFGWLLVIWVLAVVVRGLMLVAFWPVLRRCEGMSKYQKLKAHDGVVMCWGGLRGAVGLALAIVVKHLVWLGEAGDAPKEKSKQLLLFHVGGIAFLTLLVNGTSSGKLLEMLHMTDKSETTKHLEKHVEISLAKESLLKFKSVLKESVKIYEDTKLTKKVRLSASAGARARSLSLSLEDVKLSAPLFSPLPTTTGRQPRLRAQAQGDVPQGHQVLQDPRDLARDDPQVRAAGRSDHHVAARRARRRRRQGVRDVVDPGLAPDRRRRLRRRRRRQLVPVAAARGRDRARLAPARAERVAALRVHRALGGHRGRLAA